MDRTVNLLGALGRAISDGEMAALSSVSDLSISAAAGLNSLDQYPGISLAALSQTLKLSHSATVRLADELERKGLVTRRRGTGDRRAVALTLTKKGRAVTGKLRRARLSFLNTTLSLLDPKSRSTFDRAITHLLEGLTRSRAECDFMCRLCDEGTCGGETCPVEVRARAIEGQ